jgi:hypothetical protein
MIKMLTLMKGDEVVEVRKKLSYYCLFGKLGWLQNIHFRNHFKTDRIDCSFCCHSHSPIIKLCREKVVKVMPPNIPKISHFVTSLVQIELPVYIVKNLANVTITNSNNSFTIVQIFVASYRNIRANIERVCAIGYLILCIAFSSTDGAYVFCLTLFPSNPQKQTASIRDRNIN